jgi:hypothetical protein
MAGYCVGRVFNSGGVTEEQSHIQTQDSLAYCRAGPSSGPGTLTKAELYVVPPSRQTAAEGLKVFLSREEARHVQESWCCGLASICAVVGLRRQDTWKEEDVWNSRGGGGSLCKPQGGLSLSLVALGHFLFPPLYPALPGHPVWRTAQVYHPCST